MKKLFFTVVIILNCILVNSQLLVKNETSETVSICFGWYNESNGFFSTKGWYTVRPGETVNPGLNFTSNDDTFYYYAEGWEGDTRLLVKSDVFEIDRANLNVTMDKDSKYRWELFRKKNVQFSWLEEKKYTLRLTESSEFPPSTKSFISNAELKSLFNISIESLGSDFINNENTDLKPEYKIVGAKYYTVGNENYLLAAMGIKNPNECHACSGIMNVALFKFQFNQWVQLDMFKDVGVSYGWGGYGTLESFHQFGPQNYCVSFTGGYSNMGVSENYRAIVGVYKNTLKIIYSAEESYNDDGSISMSNKNTNRITQISFIPTQSGFYQLKETKLSFNKLVSSKFLSFNLQRTSY
jgi:uncharacterized membrane protein